ncbi:MAG: ribbon-helix-helix protein, CopG family [Patescibacteria group bacterium]|nr:ribbon-helix-helix protein, CopG family [Patescibacteria group bacterium]
MDRVDRRRVQLKLPQTLLEKVDACALEREMTRTELIRNAVRDYMEKFYKEQIRNKDVAHLERSMGDGG